MGLSNAERQARFRAKKAAELEALRKAAAAAPEPEDEHEPGDEGTAQSRPQRRRGGTLSNAERQAAWRARREAELAKLRKAAAKTELAKPAAESKPELAKESAPELEEESDPDDQPAHLARSKPKPAKRQAARPARQRREGDHFGIVADELQEMVRFWKKLPKPSRPVDLNWLRNPDPHSVEKMRAALELLRPKMANAEEWLEAAKQEITRRKGKR